MTMEYQRSVRPEVVSRRDSLCGTRSGSNQCPSNDMHRSVRPVWPQSWEALLERLCMEVTRHEQTGNDTGYRDTL